MCGNVDSDSFRLTESKNMQCEQCGASQNPLFPMISESDLWVDLVKRSQLMSKRKRVSADVVSWLWIQKREHPARSIASLLFQWSNRHKDESRRKRKIHFEPLTDKISDDLSVRENDTLSRLTGFKTITLNDL